MRDRLRSDDGFTIVELLVAIAILGVIMVPLAAGIFVGLRSTTNTTNRFAGSTDAQRVTIYFPPDVQSANSAKTTSISCTGVTNPKIQLTSTGGAGDRTVVYWVRSGTSAFELVRSVWPSTSCSGTAPQTIVVARNLAGTGSATATGSLSAGYKLSVTEKTTPSDPTPYTFNVTGRKRVT